MIHDGFSILLSLYLVSHKALQHYNQNAHVARHSRALLCSPSQVYEAFFLKALG